MPVRLKADTIEVRPSEDLTHVPPKKIQDTEDPITEKSTTNGFSFHDVNGIQPEVVNGTSTTMPRTEERPDDIVISGISCRLPESNNMDEFAKNLMEGIDMVTEDDRRWPPGIFICKGLLVVVRPWY